MDEAYAPTMYNLGVVFSELGRHDDALSVTGRRRSWTRTQTPPQHRVLLKARGILAGRRVVPGVPSGQPEPSARSRESVDCAADHATAIKNEDAIRTYERA